MDPQFALQRVSADLDESSNRLTVFIFHCSIAASVGRRLPVRRHRRLGRSAPACLSAGIAASVGRRLPACPRASPPRWVREVKILPQQKFSWVREVKIWVFSGLNRASFRPFRLAPKGTKNHEKKRRRRHARRRRLRGREK